MLFSEDKKFVYIAISKTGSTSIEEELQRIDPSLLRNHLVLPDGKIQRVNTHITLREVQGLLGENAGQYKFFAFVREPVEHTLSRYFYYKAGRGTHRNRNSRGRLRRSIKYFFARLLPRPIWLILYPLKPQIEFIKNTEGKVSIDFCGSTERLGCDMTKLLAMAGYADTRHQLQHRNATLRSQIGIREQRFIDRIVNYRLREDRAFYDREGTSHVSSCKTAKASMKPGSDEDGTYFGLDSAEGAHTRAISKLIE